MNIIPFHMFCSKHSDCEAPISVITEILSDNDPIKFENISNEFKALGFTKVKDLVQTTFEKASSIKLSGNSIILLYTALVMYYKHLDDLQTSAKLENQNGNVIRTQQICEELLQHKPNDLNVIILMAESFFKCGNHEKSISFLKMATNLNPNSFQMLINVTFNYWKQSQYDLAKYYLFEAIQKSPYNKVFWIYNAETFKTNGKENAEYVFTQILKVNPDSYIIRNKYGKLLLSLDKIKNAKQQFKIAQRSAPEFQETLINLGDVYFLIDKYDKAILNYNKALKVNPNLKTTAFNLAKVYLQIKEYHKAVDAFEKAIELDPENAPALRFLAVTYCYLDKMLLSVETYKKCLKLQPDDLDTNLELAKIYFHNLENFQEAEICFKKCIELNPQREDLYRDLLAVYRKLEKHINASDICMSLGELYLKKLDLENAKNVFRLAVHLNPKKADTHWKLGLILHQLGHYDLALIRYKNAIQLIPNYAHPQCDSAVNDKQ